MLLTAVLLYSNINIDYHCLSSLLVDACHGIHTYSNYHHMIWLYTFHSCVRRLFGFFPHHRKTDFGQFKFNFVYSETSIHLVVCVVFPQVSFITSGPEKLPTRALHHYIRSIVSQSVFFSCHLFIQDSWPWLTIYLETSFPKKKAA